MTATNDSEVTHLELRLSPDPTLVATVRRFVGDLCARVLGDADVTSRVIVAAHELLDNAARYSARDGCLLRVELQRIGNEAAVVIVTENKVSEERRREIAGLIRDMDASSDRAAFYQGLLRRAAKRSEGSGLGLGRVHAESELTLSSSLQGDIVRIRAEGRFSLMTGAALR
ncbi:MAG TPA: ATP-binding protein [Labilithrix sp.]|jgi:hypothetical protein|nr:ATP-binding protein [Labilithrix sp.]